MERVECHDTFVYAPLRYVSRYMEQFYSFPVGYRDDDDLLQLCMI